MEKHIVGYVVEWEQQSYKKKLKTQIDFELFLDTNGIKRPNPYNMIKSNNKIYFLYTENDIQKSKDITDWRFWFKEGNNKYLFNILDTWQEEKQEETKRYAIANEPENMNSKNIKEITISLQNKMWKNLVEILESI